MDMRRLPILAALAFAALACAHGGAVTTNDCIAVPSERFVFHNDPWINLHHFLYEWARNVPELAAGDRRRAVDVTERNDLPRLGAADRESWEKALRYYREKMVARDLTFDRQHAALRGELSAIGCDGDPNGITDTELRTILTGAMEVYRRYWWPRHSAGNAAWIRNHIEQMKTWEPRIAPRLAAAYGGEWPAERLRADVSAYAGWAGAYTTNRPNLLTMSSVAYKDLAAIELQFHEISHATFFEQKLFAETAAALKNAGASEDSLDLLVHAIQFATPAEILRAELQRSDFVSVGEGVGGRGRMQRLYPIVVEHWKPFLEGRITRAEALERIARGVKAAR